jgi:hypothetical protein
MTKTSVISDEAAGDLWAVETDKYPRRIRQRSASDSPLAETSPIDDHDITLGFAFTSYPR